MAVILTWQWMTKFRTKHSVFPGWQWSFSSSMTCCQSLAWSNRVQPPLGWMTIHVTPKKPTLLCRGIWPQTEFQLCMVLFFKSFFTSLFSLVETWPGFLTPKAAFSQGLSCVYLKVWQLWYSSWLSHTIWNIPAKYRNTVVRISFSQIWLV